MKKVALVFVLAVLLPSLVLAWLAVRSLHDQQFLLERQQSLLCQRVTDTLAQNISDYLAQQQQAFGAQVEELAAGKDAQIVAARFDSELRSRWPLAEVGFCVTLSGRILSPSSGARSEARTFYTDNSAFLGNREAVEVYGNDNFTKNIALNYDRSTANPPVAVNRSVGGLSGDLAGQKQVSQTLTAAATPAPPPAGQVAANQPASLNGFAGAGTSRRQAQQTLTAPAPPVQVQPQEIVLAKRIAAPAAAAPTSQLKDNADGVVGQLGANQSQSQSLNYKAAQTRKVSPQSSLYQLADKAQPSAEDSQNNLSRVVPAEAEFGQLIGNGTDGMLARFLQNKLRLMFWHRLSTEPDLIFGAQLDLDRVVDGLRGLVQADTELRDEICLAVLDDNAKPVALSHTGFSAGWKRPLVATEIGEALPHWEVAAYLVNPAQLTRAAHTAKLTLGLLVAVLVLAIGVGSWLIVSSLNAELKLARQKTDFVSNVSHELKTPLTSIRMFSELLAEGRVADQIKQRSYLNIITAEAARLTRLINNVLDFARMERGEKKYNFQPCDLNEIVRGVARTFRPHLEAAGFKFNCTLPDLAVPLRGDADALAQIIVNLLSNAEKYSNGGREIILQLDRHESPLPHAEVRVLDRGAGVPRGSEEKVFEKFYRAHDSLGSGVQGSGLGLTIARQIARAHGGDVVYETRAGGGSCFILRLPLKTVEATDEHK
ncbi:MAG: sensor histidine kinase [Limisphaerales bacterium]